MARKALVAVLDWGLGHAARSIPVIQELIRKQFEVILAGSGTSLRLLQLEFPSLKCCELPGYNVQYASSGNLILKMAVQIPRLVGVIKDEHRITQQIVCDEKIDLIISDNRYGCYSHQVKSIFIGHQLNILMPRQLSFLSGFINKVHQKRLKNFQEIWIPDNETGFSFSGILSHTELMQVKRIGVLSRMVKSNPKQTEHFEIIAIISGPEPQRTIFERAVRHQLKAIGKKSLMVKGIPAKEEIFFSENITEWSHANSAKLNEVLLQADVVIARSGYSSIMDLAVLGKQAILIPTPGQTEQEYLAEHLAKNKMAVVQQHENFDLARALEQLKSVNSLPETIPNTGLDRIITYTIN